MAESAPLLDPSVRAALEKLADIVEPPPPSFMPQTWGWAALAVIIIALTAWGLTSWLRRRRANRYRAEALIEIVKIESRLSTGEVAAALAALPPLLKRVALAAWPRERVASLTQVGWVKFLRATASDQTEPSRTAGPLADLLKAAEYCSPAELAGTPSEDAHACVRAARRWIESHHVSA